MIAGFSLCGGFHPSLSIFVAMFHFRYNESKKKLMNEVIFCLLIFSDFELCGVLIILPPSYLLPLAIFGW